MLPLTFFFIFSLVQIRFIICKFGMIVIHRKTFEIKSYLIFGNDPLWIVRNFTLKRFLSGAEL